MRLPRLALAALAASVGALALLSGAGAADPTNTKITVAQVPDQESGKPVEVSAKLTDDKGNALPGFLLKFYVYEDAIGKSDSNPKGLLLKMAEATTDSSGVATAKFKPTMIGNLNAKVFYSGNDKFNGSNSEFQFKAVGPVKTHVNAKFGLETVRDWAPVAVAVLVACIWATFIVVFLRVVLAMRGGSSAASASR